MSSLKKATQKGFTLVELLIVIVVIGILAALVITTYSGIQQRGRDTERTTDLKAFKSQLEAYYTNVGSYPDSTQLGTDSSANVTFIQQNMKGLDKEALRDPKHSTTTNPYELASSPAANVYSYQPTKDDGSACTAAAGDCTKFTLTAKPESGSTDIVQTSN